MSKYAKFDAVPDTKAERDKLVQTYQDEIKKTRREDMTVSCHCTARGSEYDPCCCPAVFTPNSRYQELERKLKKLVQMSFCSCGAAHIVGKKFCADCGAQVNIPQTILHQNCPDWTMKTPFCGSCGKPTIVT